MSKWFITQGVVIEQLSFYKKYEIISGMQRQYKQSLENTYLNLRHPCGMGKKKKMHTTK